MLDFFRLVREEILQNDFAKTMKIVQVKGVLVFNLIINKKGRIK